MSSGSIFSYSVGKKLIMGLTGLFLVSFLLVHVSGNLLLFRADGGVAFNEYTKFMTTNPMIKTLEWVLFGGFIVHIIYAAVLTASNRKARPEGYAYKKGASKSSSWLSRNMGLSGTVILVFLVVHLVMFWGYYHFGAGEETTLRDAYTQVWKVTELTVDGESMTAYKNEVDQVVWKKGGYITEYVYKQLKEKTVTVKGISMTEVVKYSFSQVWIVLLYVIAMVLLALHLNHGFQSAFRSLGLVHKKYTPAVIMLGKLVGIIIPIIFALMPIWYFIQSLS
ncbi:succinate dehydrogenase cytochrome b subunit [Pontibacter sp. G13]|uniref:succinate dehydrogenase cytochrome b subunit n=1 Tax=Pontibacter sp. G13 TaxID=3074898 RepID=UPI00288A165C|nr:succinate dehydrogenase cytochrome b subunit [Pontibacter sp. G13]WNJ18013.1 succinate dehydrogenase cytochrome b subunit [Pontibacter sp. G13]